MLVLVFLGALGILAVALCGAIALRRQDTMLEKKKNLRLMVFLALLLVIIGTISLIILDTQIAVPLAAGLYLLAAIFSVVVLLRPGLLGKRRPMGKIKRRIVLAAGLVMLALGVVMMSYATPDTAEAFGGPMMLASMALGGVGLLTAWLTLVSYRDQDISKTATEGQESRSQDE